ncbi:MAG TPA: hypothetical protein VL123_02150 [Candidatus Udaeobacter sp.]|jgi:hypothetical protein|nr:hypothetical protein [Candidatus Udaeobacter sp.]
MKRVSVLRSAFALLVLTWVVMAATGCAKKLTVDPSFAVLEGTPSPNARLIVYQDIGNVVYAKHEFPANSGQFLLDSTFTVYNFGPGTIQGVILDGTPAQGYEVERRQAGGGFLPIKDFPLTPATRWLQTEWEAYTFHDPPSNGSSPPTYQGRGYLSGQITRQSPLTNTAQLTGAALSDCRFITIGGLVVPAPQFGNPETFKGDTLPTITWQPVPGAAKYEIQTFQFRGDIRIGSEKFYYGIPAPIATGKVHHFFIATIPGSATSYKLGDAGSATILQNIPMIGGQKYFFRLSAIDSSGQLIGCTVGSNPDTARIGVEAFVYSAAAQIVCVGCTNP